MSTAEVLKVRTSVEDVDTGIDNTREIAGQLAGVLADTYVLMIKTHAYHWNVVGPLFKTLHDMTEEQYEELFEAADDIAERIRAIGHPAPSSLTDMISQAVVMEEVKNPTTLQMVETLVKDHRHVARRMREIVEQCEKLDDPATADLLTARIAEHEKYAWMLSATIETDEA